MTINSATRKAGPFLGNGITIVFPFSFKVFTKSDVQVTLTNANGAETALVLDSDYSVALNGDQTVSPGGTITYPISGSPLAAGYKLTVTGGLQNLQGTSLPDNGPWYPSVLEKSLDYATILIQQLKEQNDRAIKINVSDAPLTSLPSAIARANGLIGFDALGNTTVYGITASVGAGDMRVDTFTAGTDFTPGTTLQLNLSRAPGNPANLEIFFDGVFQGPDQWVLSGSTVTFTSAIPGGTSKVFARSGTTLSTSVPPPGSVGESQIVWGTILNRMVDSITALRSLNVTTHSRAFVLGYNGPGTPGGGPYYADYADTTSADNGGTIIVGLDNTRWKLAQLDWASLCQFGCVGDGSDESAKVQACIDAMKGKTIIRDAGRTFLVAGLTLSGSTYNGTTIRGEGKFKLKPDGGASTFGGAWVGLLIKDCDGVTLYDKWDGNRLAMTQREQIFCTGIAGATNLRMPDPVYVETRGDCIYVAQSNWLASSANPQNIQIGKIRHINSAVDGRNAVSIIAVTGLSIESCIARNSGGTVNGNIQPGGIDIEPDFGYETCTDIYIGPCDITTGGSSGLGVFGKSISGNDANLDWNCFRINIAPSQVSKVGTTGAAISAAPFTRVSDLTMGELTTNYDGGVRGRGPLFDYCQRVKAQIRTNNATLGCLVGSSGNAVEVDLDVYASSYDTAAIRTTSVSNSLIRVRAGSSLPSFTTFGVQIYNEGRSVTQQDVTYRVHAPYDGVRARAFRNEPGSTVAIGTGCQVLDGDWTGYPSGLANDASIPTRNVKGWNDQSAVPSVGSWVQGDFVTNTAPVQSAGKIVLGWSRLNTGSNNVLNNDWSQVVATIS